MDKLFLGIILLLFCCGKLPDAPSEKYFDPADLNRLELANLNTFWQGDSIGRYDDSDTFGYTGFLQGIEYRSVAETGNPGVSKTVSVKVFTTTDSAIQALRDAKTWSQATTVYGNPDGPIKGLWWYISPFPAPPATTYCAITVRKWNTIITVAFYPANNETIINNVLEIARRIDELSY
jgi:hypothetical protein